MSFITKEQEKEQIKLLADDVLEEVKYRPNRSVIRSSKLIGETDVERLISFDSQWLCVLDLNFSKYLMNRLNSGMIGFTLSSKIDDPDLSRYRVKIMSKLRSIFNNESVLKPYIEECVSNINNKGYVGEYVAQSVVDSSLILNAHKGDGIYPCLKIRINLTKK